MLQGSACPDYGHEQETRGLDAKSHGHLCTVLSTLTYSSGLLMCTSLMLIFTYFLYLLYKNWRQDDSPS